LVALGYRPAPARVLPDGRFDLAPQIRHRAAWAGVDPEALLAETDRIVAELERPGNRPAAFERPQTGAGVIVEEREQQVRPTIFCPLCLECGETTPIPADWKHCGCLARTHQPRSASATR
jgi:hypothetical protein